MSTPTTSQIVAQMRIDALLLHGPAASAPEQTHAVLSKQVMDAEENWVERPYVLTKSPQGLSDAPANSTKEHDNG